MLELRTQRVVLDDRLSVLHEDDASDLTLQIEPDYEVERGTGEADDIGQFIGSEHIADEASRAVNRYGGRLTRARAGVDGLWKPAIYRVFLQPGRLPRRHRPGDTEERETYQEDERRDRIRGGRRS